MRSPPIRQESTALRHEWFSIELRPALRPELRPELKVRLA